MTHGIEAKQRIMFTEPAEDLAELAAEYHELHSPANSDEPFLVDTLINKEWRLRRLRCVMAAGFPRMITPAEPKRRSSGGAGHYRHTPQPQESTTTSEFPGSFRISPENAVAAAPTPPPNPPDIAPARPAEIPNPPNGATSAIA